ncbi:hypothetical protein GE061_014083 [Apolygus lucorum]|uniref:Uncharacterized protein n=1 Tax=Apolygus lucorum TaxID=248454 RepID=A0A8S9XPK5_APOLU|nr:hypothetical protein GE061_014083 [Apolygus lucorum]
MLINTTAVSEIRLISNSFACARYPSTTNRASRSSLPKEKNRLLTNWISRVSSSLLFAAASCLANCQRCANCLEPIAAVLDPDSYHEVDPTQRSSALI